MRSTSLLTLAAALAAANQLNAQVANDDCTGAIQVVQGVNGPFSTVGATTSAPAWPCAGTGGTDVWFVYTAPGSGSLTVDTCSGARSYDTALRLFNGNAGCSSLAAIACNDDSCGLGSSITTNVNTGDTIFICLGGYNGASGTAEITINGPLGTGQVVAAASSYGAGCVSRAGSVYEQILTAAAWDLNGVALTFLNTGNGYLAVPIGAFVPPVSPTVLTLGDDTQATTPNLTTPFPYVGGSAANLTVCSNGYVSVATGNGTGYAPSVATFLSSSQTGWWCWHDMNPAAVGSGSVKFEEIGSVAYITYDGVFSYGRTSGGNTFQMQFDCSTGSVTIAWVSMDPLGSTTNVTPANQYLVGFHLAGQTLDGGPTDLSAAVPTTFTYGRDIRALALGNTGRPVAGTTMQLNTANIPATAPFGAVLLSLVSANQDLTLIGMPGCWKLNNGDVSLLFLPAGAATATTAFNVPNISGALLGTHVFVQSAAYAPASGLTPLGAISSNGLDLVIGNL
jgi:hypothetical protein